MPVNTGGASEAPRPAVEQQTLPQMEPTPAEQAVAEAKKAQATQLAEEAEAASGSTDNPSKEIDIITGGQPPVPTEASDVVVGASHVPLWPENVMAETLPPAEISSEQASVPVEPGSEGEAVGQGAPKMPEAQTVPEQDGEPAPAPIRTEKPINPPEPASQTTEQQPTTGMTPPTNPKESVAATNPSGASPEAQAKIDAITNSDGSENKEKAARQQEYKAAEQTVADLEAKKASGALTPDEQKAFDAAQKTVDKTQRDAHFEVREDKIKAMPEGDAKTEAQAKLAKEQVTAWKQDSLEGDSAYRKAKATVDAAPKDWESLAEAPKGQEAQYKEYMEAKKTARRADQAAEITARERQIAQDITLSPDARKAKVAQLEKDRRAIRKNDFLEENAKYQKLQSASGVTEKALKDSEIGLTDEDLHALGKDGIAGIKDDEKRAKVDRYAKTHAKEFRDYLINRQAMNEQESIADIAAAHERYDKGFKDDGSKMEGTDKEISEQKKVAKERKNKDFDPAKGLLWPRWFWYELNKKIDWFMGKEEMRKSGKQFSDSMKLLVGRYGLKGLIPFGIGTGKDSKQIRALQGEARKGAWGWARRGIPRLGRLFLFLMAGYWLVTPIIAGKVLEMTKPFGGGQ